MHSNYLPFYLLFASVSVTSLSGAIVIADDFTVSENVEPLTGRLTPVGNAMWTSSSIIGIDAAVDEVKFLQNGTSGTRYGGAVPFTPSAGNDTVIRVEATMSDSAVQNVWIGLGFTDSGSSTDLINDGAPWLRFDNGLLYAYANQPLANTFINGVNIGAGPHVFAMEVNMSTMVATVFVDGEAQANTYTYTTLPDIQGAGFHFHGAGVVGDNTFMDNFSVSETAIPEPSAYALMAGVAATVLIVRRRKRSL